MKRRALALLTAAAAGLVLVSAPPASASRSGSQTFTNGSGSLVVSWSFGCGTATTQTKTWQPWADVAVREVGNTNYHRVRVAYLVRETEETMVAKRYDADIWPPNSVFDPPLWRSKVLPWDPYGGFDFAPAVGFRVSVMSGSVWKPLTAKTLHCNNPTP